MAVVENGESNNRVESNDTDQSKSSISKSRSNDHNQSSDQQKNVIANGNGSLLYGNGVSNNHHQHQMAMNGVDHRDQEEEGFNKEMRDLAEMLSKLNPMAAEFVPPSLSNNHTRHLLVPPSPAAHFGYAAINNFLLQTSNTAFTNANGNGTSARRKSSFSHRKRRMNSRSSMAQREDVIKRTVYVSDIDHQAESAIAALNCSGAVLGSLPIRHTCNLSL